MPCILLPSPLLEGEAQKLPYQLLHLDATASPSAPSRFTDFPLHPSLYPCCLQDKLNLVASAQQSLALPNLASLSPFAFLWGHLALAMGLLATWVPSPTLGSFLSPASYEYVLFLSL